MVILRDACPGHGETEDAHRLCHAYGNTSDIDTTSRALTVCRAEPVPGAVLIPGHFDERRYSHAHTLLLP